MSKGLKALEHIKQCPIYDPYQDSNGPDPSYTSLIKKEPYLAPYFRDVEKDLEALEILKNNQFLTIGRIKGFIQDMDDGYVTLTEEHLHNRDIPLSLQEFNLLKEWLE